jgi:hypothetical protein
MRVQRIHLHVSKESLAYGRQLARQKKTSISKLVEGFFLAGQRQVESGKTFSERWVGKVTLSRPEKWDRRGTRLAKKSRITLLREI